MFKKSPNLKQCDKEKIFELVGKYKKIIEDRQTDSTSINEKNLVWFKIVEEFNSSSTCKRIMKQIKTFYKNAKTSLKKDLAMEKKQRFKTGGGKFEGEVNENKILAEIVAEEITPLTNEFDSSAVYFEQSFDKEIVTFKEEPGKENQAQKDASEDVNKQYLQTKNFCKKKKTNDDLRKFVSDFSELKNQKLESEIKKNKEKIIMYQTQTELLKLQIEELKRRKETHE